MATIQKSTIKQLFFDKKNANKGTQRGRGLLEKSLQKYGAGRSILVDKNGCTIAGNKTLECFGEIGLTKTVVVETDGSELVVVKRKDLDLKKDKAAKELAIADNRVGEMDLDWNAEVLAQMQIDGVGVDEFFTQVELDKLADIEIGIDEPEKEKPCCSECGRPLKKK